MDKAFLDAGGTIIMFICAIGVLSFLIEQVLKMVGKGEFITFVRIGGFATCLLKVIVEVGKVLSALRTFASGTF